MSRGRIPATDSSSAASIEETQESFVSLFTSFMVAILLIYLILGTEFQSFIQPLIVMFTVPFAFIGVVIGLVVMRYPFTLNAGVAIVALAGVVVNDSIVLVDFIKRARASGSQPLGVDRRGRLHEAPAHSVDVDHDHLRRAAPGDGLGRRRPHRGVQWPPLLPGASAFATVLTLFVIPALFSIVDDIRARFGKLDVEGEAQPTLTCSFTDALVQPEAGRPGSSREPQRYDREDEEEPPE